MELGEDSIYEHENLISLINKYKWNNVLLVGGDFKKVPHQFFVCRILQMKQQHGLNSSIFSKPIFL